MMRITDTVKHLIIINVIFFVASQFMREAMYENLALLYPQNPNFGIWRIITHMFMHGDPMHLISNMFSLYIFGSMLEYEWGKEKFLLFYFVAGVGASVLAITIHYIEFNLIFNKLIDIGLTSENIQNILDSGKYNKTILDHVSSYKMDKLYQTYHQGSIGASGAIFGIMAAFALKYPNVEMTLIFPPIPIKTKYLILFLIAQDLILGFKGTSLFGGYGDGIAHFAHLGGALTAFLLMLYYDKK